MVVVITERKVVCGCFSKAVELQARPWTKNGAGLHSAGKKTVPPKRDCKYQLGYASKNYLLDESGIGADGGAGRWSVMSTTSNSNIKF